MAMRPEKTVLIVDDNSATCYYHALLLMRLQYMAMTARTADEALMRMDRSLPALILTTITEPAKNGTDLIKSLKEDDRTRSIPVVALAAEDDVELRSTYAARGCSSCLVSPTDPHQLYRIMQAVTETIPRAHIRLKMSLKTFVGADRASLYTSTISEGGFSVPAHSVSPKHSLLSADIIVHDRAISTSAEVMYHTPSDPRVSREAGMGLRFSRISDDDREFLRGFIKDHLVHDIMPASRDAARQQRAASF